MNNNFIKLGILILVIALGVVWSKATSPKKPIDEITSIAYIRTHQKELDNEIDRLNERIKLNLEANDNNIELLVYKRDKIKSFNGEGSKVYLQGGFRLSMPCDDYCNYLASKEDKSILGYSGNAFGETKETQQCFKQYYISALDLLHQYENILSSYNNGSISKQEFNQLKKEIITQNEDIIREVDNVLELTAVPNPVACTSIQSVTNSDNSKIQMYEKLGVSKKCFDSWKTFADAEGYVPDNISECSETEKNIMNDNYVFE